MDYSQTRHNIYANIVASQVSNQLQRSYYNNLESHRLLKELNTVVKQGGLNSFTEELTYYIKNWDEQAIVRALNSNDLSKFIEFFLEKTKSYSQEDMANVLPAKYINNIMTHSQCSERLWPMMHKILINIIKKYSKEDIKTILFNNDQSILKTMLSNEEKVDSVFIQGILSLMKQNLTPLRNILIVKDALKQVPNLSAEERKILEDFANQWNNKDIEEMIEEESVDISSNTIVIPFITQAHQIAQMLQNSEFRRYNEISEKIAAEINFILNE